ncbi:hypothetical protein EDD18DRAFT_1348395 [Armillaria luteobubalina]|uniref:Uncharacterized protein n=1 Tax=Armillaria luteobubalina TaxID=153913 RepID=A0AA39QG05_9AGAR|nr:hypothetical protein EDD18DRAFT_1348395 [Armillaria luteobubalina]
MLFSFFLSVFAFARGTPASLTGDLIDALGGLVSNISVTIALESLVINLADLSFNVTNPLLVELTLERVVLSAGINTTEYISFDHTFEDPVVVPILGTADSGIIDDVALTQGGLETLNIISLEYLDLINLDIYLRSVSQIFADKLPSRVFVTIAGPSYLGTQQPDCDTGLQLVGARPKPGLLLQF